MATQCYSSAVQDLEKEEEDMDIKEEEEEGEEGEEEEEEYSDEEDDLTKPAWIGFFRVPKEDVETGHPYLPTEE